MKIIYVDNKDNTDYFINGVPTLKARVVFWDENDLFVYYTEDTENTSYINRVFNKDLKPNIFDIYNLLPIEDDAQYEKYRTYIDNNYNFQALHQGERVDGSDEKYKDDNKTKFFLS